MQFILTIIEGFSLSYFISRLIKLDRKNIFFLNLTFFFVVETIIVSDIMGHYWLMPILLLGSIMILLKIFKKNITFFDIMICVCALILIVFTDIISLLLFSIFSGINIYKIVSNQILLTIASFIAKTILIIIYIVILSKKVEEHPITVIKKWWIFIIIWILVFILIYILGEAIVFNKINIITIYSITALFLILMIALFILFYKIYQEIKKNHKNEITLQKSYFIKKNLANVHKLHNEIMAIEHATTYNLLHIKILLLNHDYKELNSFIDKNISRVKKFTLLINTNSPYFDYMINKKLNEYNYKGYNLQLTTYIKDKCLNIDENCVDTILKIIDILLKSGDKSKTFNISISKKNAFLLIEIIFIKKNILAEEKLLIDEAINTNKKILYTKHALDEYNIYKILCELDY